VNRGEHHWKLGDLLLRLRQPTEAYQALQHAEACYKQVNAELPLPILQFMATAAAMMAGKGDKRVFLGLQRRLIERKESEFVKGLLCCRLSLPGGLSAVWQRVGRSD
jgi:hypothetical protein